MLAGLLHATDRIADVVGIVRPEDCYDDSHQQIYRVVIDLWSTSRPVTPGGIMDELFRRKIPDGADGRSYVEELFDAGWPGMDVAHEARFIRDYSLLRRLAAAGVEITCSAEEPDGTARQILESAERRIFSLAQMGISGSAVPIGEFADRAINRIDQMSVDPSRVGQGVSGGLSCLDELTGGWQAGELVIVAARPSVGKTAIALQFARVAAVAGCDTLFASLEQSGEELAMRLLCAEAGVDHQAIRKGKLTSEQASALVEASVRIHGMPLHVDDVPRQTVLYVGANARRMKSRGQLGLVVVDYLQLIEPDSRREPRHEQVAQISRRLKFLARELKVPVIALAQLNRGVEDRADQKPKLSDLRESGSLEQDADVVILLHKDSKQPDLLDLIVAKNRSGPTGDVTVRFDRSRMRFSEGGVESRTKTPFE